jgi:hypothetical protein
MRYVILYHEGFGEPHYDLMFESVPSGSLMTWRSKDWPLAAGDELVRIGDHRPEYLDYEGPVSNNRGHVRKICSGSCTITAAASQIAVELEEPARSLIILNQMDQQNWRVVEVSD